MLSQCKNTKKNGNSKKEDILYVRYPITSIFIIVKFIIFKDFHVSLIFNTFIPNNY